MQSIFVFDGAFEMNVRKEKGQMVKDVQIDKIKEESLQIEVNQATQGVKKQVMRMRVVVKRGICELVEEWEVDSCQIETLNCFANS